MKKFVLLGILVASIAVISSAYVLYNQRQISNLPEFPVYDETLALPHNDGCDCQSVWCTASKTCPGGYECTCTCSGFTCSCTGCTRVRERHLQIDDVNKGKFDAINQPNSRAVGIAEAQYKNWRNLGELLRNKNSEPTDEAYSTIIEIINVIKEQDYSEYQLKTTLLLEQLQKLPNDVRSELNIFFKSIDADIQV